MFKRIKRMFLLVILLAVIAFFGATKGVNSLVKAGTEKGASHLMGVPLRIEDVSVALMSGQGSLSGMHIANPEDFKSEAAMTLEKASISLKPASLMSSKIVIHELRLEHPFINYERTLSSSNLDTIMEAILEKIPASQEGSEEARFQIDVFEMIQAQVKLSATALGGKGIGFTLPDVALRDLGKEGPGLTSAELAKEIMSALLAAVVEKASVKGMDILPDSLKGAVNQGGQALEKLSTKTEGVVRGFKSFLQAPEDKPGKE